MKNWQIIAIVIGAVIIGIGAGYYFGNTDGAKMHNRCVQETCAEVQIEESQVAVNEGPKLVDRLDRLFSRGQSKLPFVETITYTHNVPWLKGRSALLLDYAQHYKTSSQFITRSLGNGKDDYRGISHGDSFNVISADKNIQFHLVVDLDSCVLHMYAYDADHNERFLLKTYQVAVGAENEDAISGTNTPLGTYRLSRRVGMFKPGMIASVNGNMVELVQVYGSRLIPFGDKQAVYGLHAVPMMVNSNTGELEELPGVIGTHSTNGNIQMSTEDMNELFSIVTSRAASIQIVKDFNSAELPGREIDF